MEALVQHPLLQDHLLAALVVVAVAQTLDHPLLAEQVLMAAETVAEITAHKLLARPTLEAEVVVLALEL
jgi:hypothetical protein